MSVVTGVLDDGSFADNEKWTKQKNTKLKKMLLLIIACCFDFK